MEDDCVCEYDSTWDTESDGDDPAGESQTRRSNQDKNKSSWALVRAFIITQPEDKGQKTLLYLSVARFFYMQCYVFCCLLWKANVSFTHHCCDFAN